MVMKVYSPEFEADAVALCLSDPSHTFDGIRHPGPGRIPPGPRRDGCRTSSTGRHVVSAEAGLLTGAR